MPHQHVVDAFYLDVTEVTFGAYKTFVKRLSPELRELASE
jgi:hypothetical protein